MTGPHQDRSLVTGGAPLSAASAAVVAVHGRGATARSIVETAQPAVAREVAILAPQAARNSWYPHSFLAPVDENEPGRSSGLAAVDDAVGVAGDAGIPPDSVVVMGFSQGACLASEYVARHPRRYGGLAAFSGGLIGESVDREDYVGVRDGHGDDLAGTPAYLGCSDDDPHIPEERVHETAAVLEALGADVTTRIFPGMGHVVNDDELDALATMVDAASRSESPG